MKITLLIPMYNEEKNVRGTVKRTKDYMQTHFGEDYEIVFVNDGSHDGCAALVREAEDAHIRLVSYEENRGKGYAIRQGVAAARGDVIVFTDCDLAYGCDVIEPFYRAIAEGGADIAVGSRRLHEEGYEGYSLLRRVVSRTYYLVLRLFFGLRLSDSQCGCKAFRGEVAKKIFSYCEVDRFAFDFEAILIGERMGATFCELPVKVLENGESKVHLVRDTLRMIRDLFRIGRRVKRLNFDK